MTARMATDLDFSQRGAIVSIRLQQFMTYDDCTLEKPAPNLNMILGPNGSGKSAIVCAIIVGLAGDVSLTNRAATPAALVQRGRDWGSTRIELYNDQGKNYVVERKIIITKRSEAKLEHKSEWKLNGRTALKAQIVELMSKLNIKVDNLCQFLPQDSVAQFVKMNPSDLLTNTLKAAGDNRLVEQHIKLIDLSESVMSDKRKLDDLKEACRHNEVNARRLETEVVKLREREEMIKKRTVCRQKIHHVRYLEAEAQYNNGKIELENMERKLQVAKNNAEPFRLESDRCKNEGLRLEKVVEDYNRESCLAATRLTKTKESIEEKKLKCQQVFAGFKTKETQEAQRAQQIRIKEQELESYECKLNELRDTDYTREIKDFESKARAVKERLLATNSEKQTVEQSLHTVVQDLDMNRIARERVLAIREKKIQHVHIRRPDAHKLIEWLARNNDKFQKKIYLPMFCEINVKDTKNSSYLETILSEADLYAFVCESESDLRKLTRIAREELKLRINVILMPDKSTEEIMFDSSTQSQQIQRLKPDAYLNEFIDAPEAIMRYLYAQYDIHRIPVFTEERQRAELKDLLATCKKFFVGNRFYSVTKSRYDNEQVTASDSLRPARLLIHSLDVKELEKYDKKMAELQTRKSEFETKRVQLIRDYDNFNKEWHEMAEYVRKLKVKNEEKTRLETRITMCRQAIKSLHNERIDIESEKAKLKTCVTEINHDMMQVLERMNKICDSYVTCRRELFLNSLLCTLAMRNYRVAYKRYKSATNETQQLGESIREQKNTISGLKDAAERLRQYAEEKIDGFRDKKLSKKLKKLFNQIEQDTVDALEQYNEELKVKIKNICQDSNNSIMQEFNKETEELREKQMAITELEEKVKRVEVSMDEIKKTWLPKLHDVIKVIDEHYSEFMRRLNYGGKVELDHDSTNADDFKSYGIRILVKYRDNEELIPLSSTRQSGGERSVATMIYMLALQTKTTVPFRVVDEINQGMDKDNERKVFELLVRTADESSSQYFLVSPKLLSGLNYGNKMQIHVVFNGKNMDYTWASLFSSAGYLSNDTGNGSDDDE